MALPILYDYISISYSEVGQTNGISIDQNISIDDYQNIIHTEQSQLGSPWNQTGKIDQNGNKWHFGYFKIQNLILSIIFN